MNGLEIVATAVAVPLINFLKKRFGIEGKIALWLSFLVSVVLATIVFFFEGEFVIDEFLGILAIIFAGSQAIYNVIKNVK